MKHSTRVHRYTVAYDLTDDRERRRVDRLLKGWGQRVQKSVFLVAVNRYGAKTLKAELDRLTLKSGTILMIRLQAGVPIESSGIHFTDPDTEAAYIV